jgi:hypothetical protein
MGVRSRGRSPSQRIETNAKKIVLTLMPGRSIVSFRMRNPIIMIGCWLRLPEQLSGSAPAENSASAEAFRVIYTLVWTENWYNKIAFYYTMLPAYDG